MRLLTMEEQLYMRTTLQMLHPINQIFKGAVVTFTIIFVSYVYVIRKHYCGRNVNKTYVGMSEYSTCFLTAWYNLLDNQAT